MLETRRPLIPLRIPLGAAMVAALVVAVAPVDVTAAPRAAAYPRSATLTDAVVAHSAAIRRLATVYAAPDLSSRVVAMLPTTSPSRRQNVVLVLESLERSATETWYRIRLPVLPNNTTGWVPARVLGPPTAVHTHLYVDRARLRATLKRDGRTVFTTIVGVGRPNWPTPAGEYYIIDKMTNFGSPFYGPVGFTTSARSATLTDWPGGGFVGVHGTSVPQILPGRVSHGCIRMPNTSILKLASLMQPGTPLTVS